MTFDIKTDLRIRYIVPSPYSVNEIQADSYSVEIDRGISIERGVFARPDVGTATIRMSKRDLSDLLSGPSYKSNQDIIIDVADGSGGYIVLFSGIIQNVSIAYVGESGKLDIVITANDLTKVLLNTRLTNYLVTGTAAQRTFRLVCANLFAAVKAIDSRVDVTQALSGGSATTQRADGWDDTTAGEILTQFLDAELGWCWAQKNTNALYYATRSDINSLQATAWNATNLTVTNNLATEGQPYHVCMSAMDLTYDSDALVNKVKVTDFFTTATSTATNSTSVSQYGAQAADFEVTYDNTGLSNLNAWATHVAAAAQPKSIKSVTVSPVRRNGLISDIAAWDIAGVLQVEFVSPGQPTLQEIMLTSRIQHSINADTWFMTLGLWKGI